MLRFPSSRSMGCPRRTWHRVGRWLGHRLGPKEIVGDWCEAMAKMERARLGQPHTNHAIPAALQQDHPEIEAMREASKTRGQLISDRLNAIPGISSVAPKARSTPSPPSTWGWTIGPSVPKSSRNRGHHCARLRFWSEARNRTLPRRFLPNEDILSRACDGIASIAAHFQSQGA